MIRSFNLVTTGGGVPHYFDASMRVSIREGTLKDRAGKEIFGMDNFSEICAYFGLNENECNFYEYNENFALNPRQLFAPTMDEIEIYRFCQNVDFKSIL